MKIYQLDSWAVGGPLYPWSSGYGPLEDMPFLQEIPEIYKRRTEQFWITNPSPPGMEIEKKGKSWSDFIGDGLGHPFFYVSDRVISDLEEAGIEVWRKTEMPVASIASKLLKNLPRPAYYVLEAERGIDVDFVASGYPLDIEGNPLWRQRSKDHHGPLSLRANSWNGKDLISIRNAGAPMNVLCTERIKELAEQKGWTNVKFNPVPVI